MISSKQFALTAAITFGATYIVCGVVVWLVPDIAMTLLGWLAHWTGVENLSGFRDITLPGFIGGLAQVVVYSYLIALLFATTYNRLNK